jgi:hypothetical protein
VSVVAGDTYRREFAADPVQVRAARRQAMDIVRAWGLDCEEVGLVADELATNAVLHGRSPFTLIVKRDETRVVIEVVADDSEITSRACVERARPRHRGPIVVEVGRRALGPRQDRLGGAGVSWRVRCCFPGPCGIGQRAQSSRFDALSEVERARR